MVQRPNNNRKRQGNRQNAKYQRTKHLAKAVQGQARKIGQEYHNAAVTGVEVSSRSVSEFNKGLQDITDEMTDYSKRSLEEVVRAWQQLLDARLFGRLAEIQTRKTHTRRTPLKPLGWVSYISD